PLASNWSTHRSSKLGERECSRQIADFEDCPSFTFWQTSNLNSRVNVRRITDTILNPPTLQEDVCPTLWWQSNAVEVKIPPDLICPPEFGLSEPSRPLDPPEH